MPAQSQSRPAPPRRPLEQLRKMSTEAETPGWPSRSAGSPPTDAPARPVFHSLDRRLHRAGEQSGRRLPRGPTPAQRTKTEPVDDPEWRKWMNQRFYVRQGVSFVEMTRRSARPRSA